MPEKTAVIQYVNQGTGKTGRPYWNVKTKDGETFWSKTGDPIPGVAQGATANIVYDVSKTGSNNIISIGAAAAKAVMRAEMAPKDALGAFRTTAFNAYVAAGMVPLDAASIRDALRKIEAGYTQATAAPTTQSARDYSADLDDEIPDFGVGR